MGCREEPFNLARIRILRCYWEIYVRYACRCRELFLTQGAPSDSPWVGYDAIFEGGQKVMEDMERDARGEPVPEEGGKKPVAPPSKCSCCQDSPMDCKNPSCVRSRGCECIVEQQLLARLHELVQYCHQIGQFPPSAAAEQKLPREQDDHLQELRKEILGWLDTTPSRVR